MRQCCGNQQNPAEFKNNNTNIIPMDNGRRYGRERRKGTRLPNIVYIKICIKL